MSLRHAFRQWRNALLCSHFFAVIGARLMQVSRAPFFLRCLVNRLLWPDWKPRPLALAADLDWENHLPGFETPITLNTADSSSDRGHKSVSILEKYTLKIKLGHAKSMIINQIVVVRSVPLSRIM